MGLDEMICKGLRYSWLSPLAGVYLLWPAYKEPAPARASLSGLCPHSTLALVYSYWQQEQRDGLSAGISQWLMVSLLLIL